MRMSSDACVMEFSAAPMMSGDFSMAHRPNSNLSSSVEIALSPTLQTRLSYVYVRDPLQ
jgi:hypothetical protein